MTCTAFMLLSAELGSEQTLADELRSLPNVTQVDVVYGPYDLIAKVEADTMEKLNEMIAKNIRHRENIRSTLTMLVVQN